MQIGASSTDPGNHSIPLSAPTVPPSVVRQAMDLDATITGYYDSLNAPSTPLYADPAQPSVLGTMTGVHIREQLMALNEKAASLLAEAGRAPRANENCFMGKLAAGALTDAERHYFYSEAFKGKYEQMVAKADCAAPEDRAVAINELAALWTLLGDPSGFFMHVVGKKIAADFSESFNAQLPSRPPSSHGAHYPLA